VARLAADGRSASPLVALDCRHGVVSSLNCLECMRVTLLARCGCGRLMVLLTLRQKTWLRPVSFQGDDMEVSQGSLDISTELKLCDVDQQNV
jgi:hypothetical protein